MRLINLILGAALIAALFLTACEPKKVKQIAVVYDQSKSKIDGCACLAGLLHKTLQENSSDGVKINFFKLGEPTTGFEPKLVEVYELPKNHRKTEAKGATVEKMKTILTDFQTKCRNIERSNDTPLVQAVSKVVEFLKQNGCNQELGCKVFIQSDLQESVEKPLITKNSKSSTNETKFDNSGIEIAFLGVSEVEEKNASNQKEINQKISNAKSRNELKNFWKQSFLDQNLVSFFDFCTFEVPTEFAIKKE